MRNFNEYIDGLCREHKLIGHSDKECHFSDLTSDFGNKLKRLMHYPCVSLDTDGFVMESVEGVKYTCDQYNLYFLEHVRDTGDYVSVMQAFAQTRGIMTDFLRRMERDRRALVDPMTHFELAGTQGTRIEFKDAALYGWAVSVLVTTPFIDLLCNENFQS